LWKNFGLRWQAPSDKSNPRCVGSQRRASGTWKKRIRQGHLPPATTLAEYEAIILAIVSHPDAFVFVYRYGSTDYPTLVAPYQGRIWLVMFNLDGIMETAFPPDEPDTYFSTDPRYIPVGPAKEILS
jgi:hypothetical protein